MTSSVIPSTDFLQQFMVWGDEKREAFLVELPVIPRPLSEELNQGTVFCEDFKRAVYTFSAQSKYEVASFVQCIAAIAISPFAVIAELYRGCNGSIDGSTCLRNSCVVPKHVILSTLKAGFFTLRAENNMLRGASVGAGFLAWHAGERLVRAIKGYSSTVLSTDHQIRNIVYHSLGLTLLAAAAVFAPLGPIQMMALPIIVGSIYGTVNNQFTVRECPEYYTMGHYYDGTDLKGHAVKTNHVLIKPMITGCYATTMVTKIAGVILAVVGTLPYTPAVLSVSYAAAMATGSALVSLVAAHVFSNNKKKLIEGRLDAYAALIGISWTDDTRNMTWSDLAEIRDRCTANKQQEFASDLQELEKFNKRLQELTSAIESDILHPDMPIKYVVGWRANSTRNGIGYLFAGGGTLAIAVSTIFLRIFAL